MPKRVRREVVPVEEERKTVQFETMENERLLFGGDGKCKRRTSDQKRTKVKTNVSRASEKSLRQQINEGIEIVDLCIGLDPSKRCAQINVGGEKIVDREGHDGPPTRCVGSGEKIVSREGFDGPLSDGARGGAVDLCKGLDGPLPNRARGVESVGREGPDEHLTREGGSETKQVCFTESPTSESIDKHRNAKNHLQAPWRVTKCRAPLPKV